MTAGEENSVVTIAGDGTGVKRLVVKGWNQDCDTPFPFGSEDARTIVGRGWVREMKVVPWMNVQGCSTMAQEGIVSDATLKLPRFRKIKKSPQPDLRDSLS